MMKSKSVLRTSIATFTAIALTSPLLKAATVDTFSGAGNSTGIPFQLGQGAAPAVIVDGTNSVLRLVDGQNSENNHYAYDMTDAGAFETINAMFDFRITPGTAGLADGFSFMLIPTSAFGNSGDGPNPTAEEPNVAGVFGLAFDVYPGINNVSTHWNGFQVNELNPNAVLSFRDNGLFNRAMLTLQRVGNGTNATVTLMPDSLNPTPGNAAKIMEIAIPNMLPYESRAMFAARTGGENLTLDLDNVNVTYSNPFTAALPAAPTGHLYQDFDSTGTTGYRAVQLAQPNLTPGTGVFRPGPLLKAAEAGSKGSFMRIVNDNVEGQSNRIAFDRAFDGGATNATEVLTFDLRFNSTDQPADGLGLVFLRTKDVATGTVQLAGDGINSSEEPNHVGMLGVGFDVYPNGGTDVAPGVSLHWNGTKVQDVALPAELGLGQFHQIQVIRTPVDGGLNVSVLAIPNVNGGGTTPVTLIDKFFVAGASLYDYRVQFSGRTGGANSDHDIDNIKSSQIAKAAGATTKADFTSLNDSGWKGYLYGSGAPPEIRNDAGPNGNYIRLIHDTVNDNRNAIAFDKQIDGSVQGKTGINGQIDFRIINQDPVPAGAADGFSYMLIPTDQFGTTGPGVAGNIVAEEPNFQGVFGIGFDLYDNINEVSVHWNGSVIAEIPIDVAALDLDSGGFHRMRMELRPSGTDMLLDLILTPDALGIAGTPIVAANDLLIPGMSLYDYRLELAGRTGGLNMGVDLDNIMVESIPEPASAALLGLGTALLAGRRRRRK